MLERENKNIGFKTETFQSDSDESLEKSSSNKQIIFSCGKKNHALSKSASIYYSAALQCYRLVMYNFVN